MKKSLLIAFVAAASVLSVNAQNRVGQFTAQTKSFSNFNAPAKSSSVCDTITNFPSTATPTVYSSSNGGYVAGHNGYGDLAKADYFAAPTGNNNCVGMLYFFGAAADGGAGNSFNAAIYDGSTGTPGTVLSSTAVTYATATADVLANAATFVDLSSAPLVLSNDYFVGINFTYAQGDTIALITSTDGEVPVNTGWEQFDNGTWYAYDDPSSWGLSLAHAIFPILCPPTGLNQPIQDGIVIYPNPSNGEVIIHNTNGGNAAAQVNITNAMGQLVYTNNINNFAGTHRVDMSNMNNGFYTVTINSGDNNMVYRLVLNK